jgi:hypothetical protein
METAFQADAVVTPYEALPANVSLEETNPARSATARRSEALDLRVADAIDEQEMNDILWLAIKGTPAPAPVDSVFLRKPSTEDRAGRD